MTTTGADDDNSGGCTHRSEQDRWSHLLPHPTLPALPYYPRRPHQPHHHHIHILLHLHIVLLANPLYRHFLRLHALASPPGAPHLWAGGRAGCWASSSPSPSPSPSPLYEEKEEDEEEDEEEEEGGEEEEEEEEEWNGHRVEVV